MRGLRGIVPLMVCRDGFDQRRVDDAGLENKKLIVLYISSTLVRTCATGEVTPQLADYYNQRLRHGT